MPFALPPPVMEKPILWELLAVWEERKHALEQKLKKQALLLTVNAQAMANPKSLIYILIRVDFDSMADNDA